MKITIEQIETLWAKDSKIDLTDISLDSSKQMELHQKYHKILNYVKKNLRLAQTDKIRLTHLKMDYYSNNMPPQQLKELGWEPNKRMVIKTEMDRYIEVDEEMISLNLRIGEMQDMVQFLDSIIRAIYQKPFITKNIIENQKFISGVI